MSERQAGIGRSSPHTVHVLPHAQSVIARFLEPVLDRLPADADATQLLVITADADTALALADVARSLGERTTAPIVPITSVARGARLLASRVVPGVAATPGTLVALLKSSSVKLDGVHTVLIAWADELFDAREEEALEIVLAEIPKDASRIVVTDRMTPAVEALVERHLRRASRHGATEADEPTATLDIRYVSTAASTRRAALRRLLDDLDPPSAIVLARDANAAEEARSVIDALGYEGDALVRVSSTPVEEQAALVVFYDLPASADDVAKVGATEPAQAVALVSPRQVRALRRLTTGVVEPLEVSAVVAKARSRDERLRSALRAELQAGFPAREVMALEPLLAEFDGLEIAAAAVRLIERERSDVRARRVEAERPVERASERPAERAERAERPERAERTDRAERAERAERPERPERGGERAPTRSSGGFARVFLGIGERDGVRAGDLVGAITGESGITSDRIGKLEIRESHTVAEIAAADAELVVEKMNGVSMKGRRIAARIDDRPAPRSREAARGPSRDMRRAGGGDRRPGGFREGGRGAPREGGRGGFGSRDRERPPRDREAREGGREGRFPREGRPSRGPAKERFGGAARRPRGADDRPRRGDDRPRGPGAFRDRPDEGRVPRATHERQEWSDRADRVRNARRPRRDDA